MPPPPFLFSYKDTVEGNSSLPQHLPHQTHCLSVHTYSAWSKYCKWSQIWSLVFLSSLHLRHSKMKRYSYASKYRHGKYMIFQQTSNVILHHHKLTWLNFIRKNMMMPGYRQHIWSNKKHKTPHWDTHSNPYCIKTSALQSSQMSTLSQEKQQKKSTRSRSFFLCRLKR